MSIKNLDIYWSLLEDCAFPAFYSGTDTKKQHAQMQWLFQGVMMHMTLQAQASLDSKLRANFQLKVEGTDHRINSPVGFYMDEADFDYFEQSSYIPTFFAKDEWLRHIVSSFIGWVLTDDQAMMLMHLEVIHDNYAFDDMFEQFGNCATHFGLFLPERNADIPTLQKPPEAVQPSLQLVH